jgi:hypothetical protein
LLNEIAGAAAEDSEAGRGIREALKQAGATDEQIDAMSEDFRAAAAARAQARQQEDATRPPAEANPDGGKAEFKRFQREIDRQRAEQAGVEAGQIDPAATTPAPQRPSIPDVIQVAPTGQANVAAQGSGLEAGQQLRSGRPNANALVPVDPNAGVRRGEMTPDEVAAARRQMEAGNPNTAPAQDTLVAPENRAPQTRDDIASQREAAQAFTAADAQRGRVAPDVRDTQAAGRPEGVNAQPVLLDDGFPVQVLERQWANINGRTVEVAKVQRYDPRTGQPEPDAEPYLVQTRDLKRSNYAADPRQAQDFAERAQGPRNPEQPRMEGGPVTREPDQTYRATAPDPEVPGADGPASNPADRGPITRAARPEQPEGSGPWRERSTREDDYIRDFEARQQNGGQRQQSQNDYASKEWSGTFTNRPKDPDPDGRFAVDDAGHVLSSKGGPVRFGDQKQAAKWIVNVGHKTSPDQFFEIVNHPGGSGFSVREQGRNSGPNDAGPKNDGPRPGARREGAAGPQKAMPAPKQGTMDLNQPAPEQSAPAQEAAPDPTPQPRQDDGRARKPGTIFDLVARLGGIKDALANKYRNTVRGRALKRGGELDPLYTTDKRGRRVPLKVKIENSDDRTLRLFGRPLINYKSGRDPDYVREAAVEAGFLPPDATIDDLYAALARQAAGEDVFAEYRGAENDPEGIIRWREQQALDALEGQYGEGPDQDASLPDEEAAARDYIAAQLDRMGENVDPDADLSELAAQLDERLAIADAVSVDEFLSRLESDENGREDQGNANDQAGRGNAGPAGAAIQNGGDAEGARRGDGQGNSDRGGVEAPAPNRKVTTERTDQGDQIVMPGAERSAVQAQQSRDAGSGRLKGDVPQKAADEGLFGPKRDLGDFFSDERGSLDLTALAEAFKKMGLGVQRALFDGPLAPLASYLIGTPQQVRKWAEDIGNLAKAIGNGTFGKTLRDDNGLSFLTNVGSLLFRSSDGRIRMIANRFSSPTLNKVINMIAAPGGELNATGKTFDEEIRSRASKRTRQLQDILRPVLDADMSHDEKQKALAQVARLVRNPRSINSSTKLGKIAADLTKFLKEELEYMRAAGVEIGEVATGYFPREISKQAVAMDQEGFLDAATKLYMADQGMSRKDARAAAVEWMANVLDAGSGNPLSPDTGGNKPAFQKERVFGKVMESIMEKFMVNDPDVVLKGYVYNAAKRAAIARRFGDNWSKWKDIERQIVDEGASGALSDLREHVAVATGVRRYGGSEALNRTLSMVRTWTTLGLLEKAAITSLVEPFTSSARTGNAWDGLHGAWLTAREIFRTKKMGKTELREFAEDIGAISGSFDHAIMMARFTGDDVIGQTQKDILAAYYHRIGLELLTNASIVAQVQIGATFLRRQALNILKGGASEKTSRLHLQELGIPTDKIDAFAKAVSQLKNGALPTQGNMGGEMGDIARDAIYRFQTQVIQQPTAAMRPRWASSPVGQVIFQLGAWSYAFARNITLRAAKNAARAVTQKDLTMVDRALLTFSTVPGFAMMGLLQYGLGELRDWWEDTVSAYWSPDGKSTRRELTDTAKVERALSRTGIFGGLDPYINMLGQLRYGRDAASTWSGPTGGRLAGGINALGSLFQNSENTNTTERKLAATTYDLLVEPFLNMALTWSPPGALATAAGSGSTVLGIPALKEWFVSEIAGPQDRKARKRARSEPIKGITETIFGN